MKKRLYLLVALPLILVFSACDRKERLLTKIIYQGMVYEESACGCKQPSKGVRIILKACAGHDGAHGEKCINNQFTVGETLTDEHGQFFIKEKAARTNWYFVYKQKAPYNDAVNGPEGTSAEGLHTAEYREIYLY